MKQTKSISISHIINLPLSGKILIEASAGTGKTFSLVVLYLKLLLGIGKNDVIQKQFLVREILVVTFTRNAKKELKHRIQKYIHDFKIDCIKKNTNCILHDLFKKIKNLNEAIYLLSQAENSTNNLEIYTIHEFCYKSLNINKFCSNILFQKTLIKNKHNLYLKSSNMFWNKYFSFLPKNISNIILQYFRNPSTLLNKILPILSNYDLLKQLHIKKTSNTISYYNELIKKIKFFKKQWIHFHKNIFTIIEKSTVNKHIYTKSNLIRWIHTITTWSLENTNNLNIPKELKYFQKKYLVEKNITENISKNKIFEITEIFLKTNFTLKTIFFMEATLNIRKIFIQQKKRLGLFEFDDLIQFLYSVLNKKNENISNIIKTQYPVLLIDEFQDTNYKQYEIFNKIYKSKKHLFVLMSDPKQAIYSFRGADIASYVKAKRNIKRCYQLDTNWRSSKEMVDNINFLFLRIKNVFLLHNICFTPVKSIYKENCIKFKINGILQPALRFLINKDKEIKINDYKKWISKSCANYIAFWISEGKKRNAVIEHNKNTRFVSEKDICILVNNKKEAAIIKEALQEVNISTTYLSQRDSVFHSIEALELLWILKSILNPKNEFMLKRAISTKIISMTSQNIDSLEKKYSLWSSLIKKFFEYLTIWKKFGITQVIYKIITNYKTGNVHNNFETNIPDINNILHITELLEKKSYEVRKKHILILWLEKKIAQKNDITHTEYERFKNYQNHIEIVTIHKSKGLEYPITCIPFFTTHYDSHNSFNIFNDTISKTKNSKKILSENMRLLYVALTRAIVHCFIGIACVQIKKTINKHNYSNLHKNALGYIIQLKKNSILNNCIKYC
ncbi:MAG: UvrD-helicase domain-containing protein [Buchnera aphidicola (Schlechtendalia peitan)]